MTPRKIALRVLLVLLVTACFGSTRAGALRLPAEYVLAPWLSAGFAP